MRRGAALEGAYEDDLVEGN